MSLRDRGISTDDFLWLLAGLARLGGVPFDPNAVLPRYPAPRTPAHVALVASEFGLKLAPVPGGVTPVAALGWIGWRTVDAAEATGAETAPRAAAGDSPLPASPVLIERDANGRTQIHAPRPSEALARAARGESKLDLIESWVIQRDAAQDTARAHADDDSDTTAADGGEARRPFGFPAIWREVMRYPAIWRQVLLASLAIQVVGLGTPLLTQVIIDKVLVHHTVSTLIVVSAALVVFMLFSSGMTWIRQYLILHTGSRIDAVLGDSVFGHLLRLPVPWFEKRPTGTVIARLQGIETIREFLTGATVSLVLDIPFLCIFLAIMFAYSWQLSLIAVAITGAITLLSLLVTPVLRRRLDQQFLAGARAQAFTTEYVSGYETVKALQLEPTLQRRYGSLLADHLATTFSTRQLGNTFGTLAGGLEQLMTLGILVAGALLVMRSDGFTVGMLVAFQMFASRMSQPMMRLVGLWQEFQQASIAVKRLGDLMNAPAEPHTQRLARTRGQGPAELSIEDVSFRYGDNQPWTLRHLDLLLERGKLTVLTGPSGSGKSTLTKLLLGYRRPNEGRIRLDGKDIAFLAANELRADFGVVPQDTVLFSGTILDNLRIGHPDAPMADLVAACKLAEIHDTIERLPRGYETPVGEHGVGLSGGQRQRLSIARALLRQPRVLIFDEATSALDVRSAQALARTVNQLRGRTTMLFIAHHVPTNLQADRSVSMPGVPVAQDAGTHGLQR